jgi:DNA-binding GntR family transcriptional regulator
MEFLSLDRLAQDLLPETWSVAALGSSDTLQERVTAWLRGAILSGHFVPGDRLIQSDIADHLKVSITPVREAMRDLAVEGLLTLNPRRGITVRALSQGEVQELRMLCAMLERKCGQLIAERITEDELRHARTLERAMASLTGLQDYFIKNNQFHLFLYETARSPELIGILRRIHDATLSYLPAVFARTSQRFQNGLDEHRVFIDACEARDAETAGDVMMRHWDLMFAQIENIIAESPAPPK